LLVGFLLIIAILVGELGNETGVRKQLGGDFAAGVHDSGVNEESICDAVDQ